MTERQEAMEREAGIVERLWSAERSFALWRSIAALLGAVAIVELAVIALF